MKTKTIRGLLRGARERLGVRQVFFLPAGRVLGSLCPLCLSASDVPAAKQVPPGSLVVLSRRNVIKLRDGRSRRGFFRLLLEGNFSCIALADNDEPPEYLRQFCFNNRIALLRSTYEAPYLISRLTGLIRERICHTVVVHGVLVNLYGLGLLITGDAGVGKTACGLELAKKGHAWIADDLVEVVRKYGKLHGSGFGSAGHYVALRDRGLVAREAVAGISRVMPESILDLWCNLTETLINPGGDKQRRLLNVPLAFSTFPAINVSGQTPILIEQWVKTVVFGKERL